MEHDYVPETDGKLLDWSKNLFDVVDANAKAYGLDPLEYGPIVDLIDDYAAMLAKVKDPNHGKADIKNKNVARKTMKASIRKYVQERLDHNHLIGEGDRIQMGLPVHKDTRTPAPIAEDAPEVSVDTSHIGRLKIYFYIKGSNRRQGKPEGQHCGELVFLISETRPAQWSEMVHSLVDTNSPFELVFEDDQRGQKIWFSVRWENTRGEKGPWSPITMAIIP